MNSTIKQLLSSVAFSLPVSIILATAAHSQSITPQTQPDCAKVVCTRDQAAFLGAAVTTTITPEATITQVCYPNSCSSSWVPHEMDTTAIGHEPQVFVIPESDRN